jgi:hypothetical protein
MLTLPTIAGNRKKRPNRAANFMAHRNRDPGSYAARVFGRWRADPADDADRMPQVCYLQH